MGRLSVLFILLVVAIVVFVLAMLGPSGIDAAACRILGGAFHEGLCADRRNNPMPLQVFR